MNFKRVMRMLLWICRIVSGTVVTLMVADLTLNAMSHEWHGLGLKAGFLLFLVGNAVYCDCMIRRDIAAWEAVQKLLDEIEGIESKLDQRTSEGRIRS